MRLQHAPLRTGGALLCGAASLLAFTACGGHGDAGTDAATTPTPSFAPGSATPGLAGASGGATMPDMPGMTGMTSPAAPPAAPAGPDAVNIDNFAFTPASLTVPVGTTVTWTNRDDEPHTVASSDGTFHSSGMGSGATFSFTFTRAGRFDYICSIHPFMHATVVVTP